MFYTWNEALSKVGQRKPLVHLYWRTRSQARSTSFEALRETRVIKYDKVYSQFTLIFIYWNDNKVIMITLSIIQRICFFPTVYSYVVLFRSLCGTLDSCPIVSNWANPHEDMVECILYCFFLTASMRSLFQQSRITNQQTHIFIVSTLSIKVYKVSVWGGRYWLVNVIYHSCSSTIHLTVKYCNINTCTLTKQAYIHQVKPKNSRT